MDHSTVTIPSSAQGQPADLFVIAAAIEPFLKSFFEARAGAFERHLEVDLDEVEPAWTDEFLANELRFASLTVALNWLRSLIEAAQQSSAATPDRLVLDARSLDDAMLPAIYQLQQERWVKCLEQTLVTLNDALWALRAYRTFLKRGQRLPDSMTACLMRHGVTVLNA